MQGAVASRAFKFAGLALAVTAIAGLMLAERAVPLRRRTASQFPRLARNAVMGAACQAVVLACEVPLTEQVAARNAACGRGLQHAIGGWPGRIAGFLAMDYTMYLWHIATHKMPLLWRLHRVHHVDPDCDVSTALRFHFLDMLVSLPWRLVQVRLAGLDRRSLAAWRGFFSCSVLFHHANLRLPRGLDEWLSLVVTTPRMHGIHHSDKPDERDSNWTSGLSLWDRLHGTLRVNVAQDSIRIGVDDPMSVRDAALLAAHASVLRPAKNQIGGQ